MTKLYFLFAAGVFGMFCMLEYQGASTLGPQLNPSPRYYSYRGSSSRSGGYYGGSSSSRYSHK